MSRFNPIPSPYLFAPGEDEEENSVARKVLNNHQIKFTEISRGGTHDYTRACFLVSGRPYQGLEEIKRAAMHPYSA